MFQTSFYSVISRRSWLVGMLLLLCGFQPMLAADDWKAGFPENTQFQLDVPYKQTPQGEQLLDIYRPAPNLCREALPVVLFIHGGSWMHGNKKEVRYGWQKQVVSRLLREGFAVVSINYRLIDKELTVTMPQPISDCKDAVRWLRCYASHWGFDADRIAVMGTSAGGHLSLMTAAMPDANVPCAAGLEQYSSRVQCVVDIYGPTDIAKILKSRLFRPLTGLAKAAMGEQAVDMRARLLWAFSHESAGHPNRRYEGCLQYSPMTYVPLMPPTIIFHGNADKLVSFGHSLDFYKSMVAQRRTAEIHMLEGQNHGFSTITPTQVLQMQEDMVRFLKRCM